MSKVKPEAVKSDPRPLLTLSDVATRTKHAKRTVQRWIDDGKLRAIHIGRSVRIHEDDLQAFIHAHRS